MAVIHSNTREMVVGFRISLFDERRPNQRRRSSFVAFVRGAALSAAAVASLPLLGGCAPKVSAGAWQCPSDGGAADGGASDGAAPTDPVTIPWSTGFEDGFCDYTKVAGSCYGDEPYVLSTEQHHLAGHYAAEFNLIGSNRNPQTRCIREGVFPESAYYGAWYYLPEALEAADLWNLFHFTGRDDPNAMFQPLWDVTLDNKTTQPGEWELIVFDNLAPPNTGRYANPEHKPVPIRKWFHIELFVKRAADSTGEIALYQDGVLLLNKTNLKSNLSKWCQWYVGDLASNAKPVDSFLYVDDVSIRATLSSTSATQ
jgi:hypothetical protein